MNDPSVVIKKLYQTLHLMACESKMSKTYGTSGVLTTSDIDFLKCVQMKKDVKACEISACLGVTSGAVTQLARKLEKKGYLEPYRVSGNKKEKYYRLTEGGESACRGFDEHYAKIASGIGDYLRTLDDRTVGSILGLLDVIADNLVVRTPCSVKHGAEQSGCLQKEEGARCEKCQNIY